MLFPDSLADPCSSGWESPQPGHQGQRGSPAFLQTDGHWTLCPQAFLGQRRRSHTEPQNYRLHPNASLQQTNIHLRDAARRHVTGARAAITGYTQTSQTAHKNSHASDSCEHLAAETSTSRNSPEMLHDWFLTSNLCRRHHENIRFFF